MIRKKDGQFWFEQDGYITLMGLDNTEQFFEVLGLVLCHSDQGYDIYNYKQQKGARKNAKEN